MKRFACPVLAAAVCLISAAEGRSESNWAQWRGPQGNGHATEAGLPVEWSADSVVWKTKLPGQGNSSPVVWGDRIFLTSALESGRQRVVLCVDRNTGKIQWQQVAWTGTPEPVHKMNGWASATCTTDGERVYAFFGRGGGLHCYTVDGQHVWSKPLGDFEGPWGTAASPLLVGDLLIQNCDAERDASLLAVQKKTGETAWKTRREDVRGWGSPVLIEAAGRRDIVINGQSGVRSYDPETGKELWFCKGFAGRGEPTPLLANGLIHMVNGLRGDVYAVRPGGSGNVTGTHMAWHTPRKTGRDLPSPIAIGTTLLVMELRGGLLTGYDTATGQELWRERAGNGDNFAASPVAWDGRAFFIGESGTTVVVDPAAESKVVARNVLSPDSDEIFRSSITPDRGQVLIRSDRALYCVGKGK